MEKTNITARVDAQLKTNIELACDYFGETVTSVIHHAFRQKIDQYYKAKSNDTRLAREIADGDNFQLMLDAAKREAYALQKVGFDTVYEMLDSADKTKKKMFYEFLIKENFKDLGIDYKSTSERNACK